MAKDMKNLNIEVTYECWKRLKIISLSKDLHLQDLVRDILEKYGSSKKVESVLEEN